MAEFAGKLRRLADALEQGSDLRLQVGGGVLKRT
jgi:hypothetical protein